MKKKAKVCNPGNKSNNDCFGWPDTILISCKGAAIFKKCWLYGKSITMSRAHFLLPALSYLSAIHFMIFVRTKTFNYKVYQKCIYPEKLIMLTCSLGKIFVWGANVKHFIYKFHVSLSSQGMARLCNFFPRKIFFF